MSEINSLPVAPEFVESLQEQATKTAIEYLEKIKVPEEIIQLIRNINDLSFYTAECYRNPAFLMRDRYDRFDIEGLVIESINNIAKSGGVFHGAYSVSVARDVPLPTPMKVRK